MLLLMENQHRLVEAEIAACVVALVIIAFCLMLGHTLWFNLVRR